jgi:hypothetical protein
MCVALAELTLGPLPHHATASCSVFDAHPESSEVRQLVKVLGVRNAGQQNRPMFIGADSAHAQDQSPDPCEWIVDDDLQNAILRFRCHASPFGRDNCRLFAGSTENSTRSVG